MQKPLLSFLFTGTISSLLTGCGKDDDTARPNSANLQINVRNPGPAPGIPVKLFASHNDFALNTNQLGATEITDANGNVYFNNLQPGQYYWRAQQGCSTNLINGISQNSTVVAAGNQAVTSTLAYTSYMKVENPFPVDYKVKFDTYGTTAAASSTKLLPVTALSSGISYTPVTSTNWYAFYYTAYLCGDTPGVRIIF